MCYWVTLLYSRKLTEHCKPAVKEKSKIIKQKKKTKPNKKKTPNRTKTKRDEQDLYRCREGRRGSGECRVQRQGDRNVGDMEEVQRLDQQWLEMEGKGGD